MAGVCTLGAPRVEADAQGLALELDPSALRAGDRSALSLTVRLPPHARASVALTPSSEGATLEVVRGRVLGAEAVREADAEGRDLLRFRVPVIAHAPGAAVLRVEVDALVCAETCEHLRASERFDIEIGQRAP